MVDVEEAMPVCCDQWKFTGCIGNVLHAAIAVLRFTDRERDVIVCICVGAKAIYIGIGSDTLIAYSRFKTTIQKVIVGISYSYTTRINMIQWSFWENWILNSWPRTLHCSILWPCVFDV